MKKNNKGFMLAELVISATMIVTIMVSLYSSFNHLRGLYNTRSKYLDVETLYAAENCLNYLKMNPSISSLTLGEQESYDEIIIANTNPLITQNGIKLMYLVRYDKSNLSSEDVGSLKNTVGPSFDEYLTYLENNLDFNESYNYIFIVERENGYYSNIKF